jgi:hypothetical protein
LRHHIGVAAELIVGKQADGNLALGFLCDRLDRFLQPHVDRMGDGKVVAEFQFDGGALRQDCGTFERRGGCDRTNPDSAFQQHTTANGLHCIPPSGIPHSRG